MQRKLTPDFIKDFKPGGKYDSIIPAVKADSDLSLEIRTKSEVKIYYNKGLILTINNKGVIILSDGYFRNQERPTFDLKSPQRYFAKAKELIRAHSRKTEFTIQQNIAMSNQSSDSSYFVVDMEWQYPQYDIPSDDRLAKSRIDIIAIEKETNDIILFELKQGTDALNGASGVEDHLRKTSCLISNSKLCSHLREDVRNIIEAKNALGLTDYPLPDDFGNIRQMFIFAYNDDRALAEYRRRFVPILENAGVETKYIDTRFKL